MIIGNGDKFGDVLMKSQGTCPNCGKALPLAMPHNWQDPMGFRTMW